MGDYPANWKEIAAQVKEAAGWRCVRCGHPHEAPGQRVPCDEHCDASRHDGALNDGKQRVLTVHHLDGDKANCEWWNLAALCQRCHLQIQAKVRMEQVYPWEHSEWFKPYAAGYYAWKYLGQTLSRVQVEQRMEQLLRLEQMAAPASNDPRLTTRCSICHEFFTEDEWEDRHSDEDGEDCHERCCPVCAGEEEGDCEE